MQINEVSATPVTPSPCKYCGSILDQDGKHTDKWVRSWVVDGKRKRPQMYRVWNGMKTRCRNPNCNSYKYYGARGFTICDEWEDYAVFRQWMIDQGFRPGLKIDRKDNDQSYFPENCRLATDQQQVQNRRLPTRHKTGKRYNNTALTEDDVYAIRASDKSQTELGRIYDVHSTTIRNIKLRKSWRDCPERVSIGAPTAG